MLFEHGFYLTKPNWTLICLHDVTRESIAVMTDHFTDDFFAKMLHAYMTLWRRNILRKFDDDVILFREIQCKLEGDNDNCPRMVRFCACVICF